ncbi:putative inhibitor of apoptosis isoform X2 [Stegodyphus dumicola]|nr:putative inhibitor of apoptosis isoform X2 [Stegodyphus dumicola]
MDDDNKVSGFKTEHLCSEVMLQKQESTPNNNLHFESERIKTFSSWPVHFPVDPARLAKAGFYYTGNDDEVVCFSCQGHVKDWNYGDVVLRKHAELYPHCDFINKLSNNVPIGHSSSKIKNDTLKTELITKSVIQLSQSKNDFDYEKMKSLSERLKTFIGKWPLTYIDMRQVAHAGFFYLGCEDRVQCPYCKGIVSNWEVGDDPLDEHLKHFPGCGYLSNFKSGMQSCFHNSSEDVCGNMKRNNTSESVKCRLLDESQQHINLQKLGVHLHKGPTHPQQASLSARLRSFVSWPSNVPVSKEDLAEAGFFYIGISDHVKCFHCNGGLCNWEIGDDPWVEHARWFCNCDFLRMNKGEAFIESCLQKYNASMENVQVQSSSVQHSESLLIKIDEAMNSNLVKYVLETGLFPKYIVRAAILRQINETGSSFSNIDDLCVAVSYLKEEMEKEPIKINNSEDLNGYLCEDLTKCTINPVNIDLREICSEDQLQKPNNTGMSHAGDGSLSNDQYLCKICMDKEVGVVFLPCGHLLACISCAPSLKLCPMCRKVIKATVRAYLP